MTNGDRRQSNHEKPALCYRPRNGIGCSTLTRLPRHIGGAPRSGRATCRPRSLISLASKRRGGGPSVRRPHKLAHRPSRFLSVCACLYIRANLAASGRLPHNESKNVIVFFSGGALPNNGRCPSHFVCLLLPRAPASSFKFLILRCCCLSRGACVLGVFPPTVCLRVEACMLLCLLPLRSSVDTCGFISVCSPPWSGGRRGGGEGNASDAERLTILLPLLSHSAPMRLRACVWTLQGLPAHAHHRTHRTPVPRRAFSFSSSLPSPCFFIFTSTLILRSLSLSPSLSLHARLGALLPHLCLASPSVALHPLVSQGEALHGTG